SQLLQCMYHSLCCCQRDALTLSLSFSLSIYPTLTHASWWQRICNGGLAETEGQCVCVCVCAMHACLSVCACVYECVSECVCVCVGGHPRGPTPEGRSLRGAFIAAGGSVASSVI